MIDLSKVRSILEQCTELLDGLNGQELDETDALVSQSKGGARQRKARLSQDLQLLATRLELAAALVRNEYWFARDGVDPLDAARLSGDELSNTADENKAGPDEA